MPRRSGTVRFGPLAPLADDPQVTDVAVTCDGTVWADRGDGMREHRLDVPLDCAQVLRDYAVQLCSQLGRRLDDASPIADASTPDGIRVHAVIAPLVPSGASLSIRFPDRSGATIERLQAAGMMPALWAALLHRLVAMRASLLITGGTGAGKTTLLRALLAASAWRERIITVEEVRELGDFAHPNHVSLATREANVEGAGAVGLAQLVKATLRMRPDRIVLGECRGEEIADLLRAFNSGHRGGMATLHADGVARVPSRLAALGMLAGMTPETMAMFAEGAFDAVLHLERVAGRRMITQIGRLAVGEDGRLRGQPLSAWDGVHAPWTAAEWTPFIRRWGLAVRATGGGAR